MAGPGIRAWHVAEALSSSNDVELVTTATASGASGSGFGVRAVDERDLRELERWCDIFVFQGWVLGGRPFLQSSSKILVADLYDPMHLEQLERARGSDEPARRARSRAATAVLCQQLLRGDFFVCASERQRFFWLGHLAALGRVNTRTYDEDKTLRSLIDVVPFGVPDTAPERGAPAIKGVVPGISHDDLVILWGGGVYDWLDPLTLVRAMDRLRHTQPRARLFFMGMSHPAPDAPDMVAAGQVRSLSDSLGLSGTHVFFNDGWVEHARRQDYLLDADIGVTIHESHLETELSFRTRVVDYIWGSLPVVATKGDAMADLVASRRIGLTVPPSDVEALEAALGQLLGDEELRKACGERCRTVAAELAWPNVLAPLVRFCNSPRRAPDLVDPDIAADIRRRLTGVGPPGPVARVARAVSAHLRAGGPRQFARAALGRARRFRA